MTRKANEYDDVAVRRRRWKDYLTHEASGEDPFLFGYELTTFRMLELMFATRGRALFVTKFGEMPDSRFDELLTAPGAVSFAARYEVFDFDPAVWARWARLVERHLVIWTTRDKYEYLHVTEYLKDLADDPLRS